MKSSSSLSTTQGTKEWTTQRSANCCCQVAGERRILPRSSARAIWNCRFLNRQGLSPLRFPVFARNRNDYDVLFYVANWPAPRHPVWETLLRARAIENQAYVIGVSRSGVDGEGVDHLGGSCVINPKGEVEAILDHRPGILQARLDLKKIREFREKFPVWKDADSFSIEY